MARPLALIIEDNVEIADIYATTLNLAGYEAESIVDGKAALDRLDGNAPDLVILDMNLPQVSGNYIYNRIRGDARLAEIPIIISTANMLMAEALSQNPSPFDYILVKPVSPQRLRELVKSLAP
jgi:CheY-like chemotaxis protein